MKNLVVMWFGKCPSCGSYEIRSLTWGNICERCGYTDFQFGGYDTTSKKELRLKIEKLINELEEEDERD